MHPSDIARQVINTRVHKMEQIGKDHLIVELRTPRSSTLQFLAGQFVDLTIEGVEGRFHGTIASCPCNGMYLQFHFQNSSDPFVEYMFSQLQRGQTVRVTGPYGQVTFNEQHTHPVIFITQDHHFAGVKSLIEQAINLGFEQPVRLYWIMSENRPHYMKNYCRVWKDHFEDYRFIPNKTAKKSINRADVKQIVREIVYEYPLMNFDLYLSLAKTDARMIKRYLSEKGFSADQVLSISKNIKS
jgi:CDP-4-dehydro-6-deoxyglucose reductase